jgi:hypothetical protein
MGGSENEGIFDVEQGVPKENLSCKDWRGKAFSFQRFDNCHEVSCFSLESVLLHILSSTFSVVKEINKINQLELELGVSGASWHDEYKDSAYIFVGGLHFDLTEGDVITIFSQYVHLSNRPLDMSNVHADMERSWILICLVTKKLGKRKVSDF